MPFDPLWTPVTETYPDARAQRSLGEKKSRLLGWMERVFCVNCGKDGGMVSKDWAAHIFYLCDACAQTHGHLPLMEIPPAVAKGRG